MRDLKPHPTATHSSHTPHSTTATAGLPIIRQVCHCRLRGRHERSHGRRVLQRSAHDLGGVDDARLDHVNVHARGGVEAEAGVGLLQQLADDDVTCGGYTTGVIIFRVKGNDVTRRQTTVCTVIEGGEGLGLF